MFLPCMATLPYWIVTITYLILLVVLRLGYYSFICYYTFVESLLTATLPTRSDSLLFYYYDLVASKMGASHVYTRIIYSRFTPHLQRSVLVLAQGVHHTIRHAKKLRAESIGLCARLLHKQER